jgi:hypothetical protein
MPESKPAATTTGEGRPAGCQEPDGERRLVGRAVRWLGVLALVGLLVSGWGALVSVLAGGALALVNYLWLRRAVDGALARGGERRVAAAAAGFVGRFGLILAGLFAIVQLSFLSLLWAVGGLSVFVLAGIEEAIRLLLRR